MYDRSNSIGASDAVHIHAGQWAALYDRKKATTRSESGLAARIGHATEELNRSWFTEQTDIHVEPWHSDEDPAKLGDYGGDRLDWYTYLPDGVIHDYDTTEALKNRIPWEAKAINANWRPHLLRAKYLPQLLHQMRVMNSPYAILSVIYLNTKWEYYKIEWDEPAADALLEKEKLFYWHLINNERPPEYLGKRKGWT